MTAFDTRNAVLPSFVSSALADAAPVSFWLDNPRAPAPREALTTSLSCDLLVVGGGFTGLWTALLAKEADPSRDVVLVECERIGWAASGRNGGFVSSSLTHGLPNGVDRFPDELPTLLRLGEQNLAGIESTMDRYGIAADWERNGELTAAYDSWQVDELAGYVEMAADFGIDVEFLDRDRMQAEVHSPTYLGGLHEREGTALVDPAKLAWGLAEAAERLGVQVFERTRVTGLAAAGDRINAATGYGQITARRGGVGTERVSQPRFGGPAVGRPGLGDRLFDPALVG